MVGIEFIGLSGDATKQIQNWMDSKREFSEASKTTAAVADRTVARETGTEIAAKGTTAESELSDLRGANTSQPPILPPVQYSPETNAALMRASELVDWATGHRSEPAIPPSVQRPPEANDAPTIAATPSAISVGGVGKAVKLVGPPLVGIAILLSVFFLRSLRVRESANTQKNKEPTRAVQPAAPPTQSVQLVPSGRRPQVPPSQPAASVSSPAMPAANQKPTLLGPAYVLQVAAMISENNANALANSLSEMNFPAFVLKMPTERFHHVFVGPYDSKDAGTEVKKDLAKRGFQVIRREWPVKTQ